MQIDITDLVQRYRLALRHIWNCCIWVDPALRDWEAVYSFRELKLPLFRALVANPLGLDKRELFGEGFHVVPDASDGSSIPKLQVNSRVPSSPSEGIWIPLNGPFQADEIDLTLIDLFDWTPLGYIDLRYYVVLIEACRKHPDKAGQHALVDVKDARVLWTGVDQPTAGNQLSSGPEA